MSPTHLFFPRKTTKLFKRKKLKVKEKATPWIWKACGALRSTCCSFPCRSQDPVRQLPTIHTSSSGRSDSPFGTEGTYTHVDTYHTHTHNEKGQSFLYEKYFISSSSQVSARTELCNMNQLHDDISH